MTPHPPPLPCKFGDGSASLAATSPLRPFGYAGLGGGRVRFKFEK